MINIPQRSYSLEPWSIRATNWSPGRHRIDESVFSIGNASMGIRANFEETYSGPSLAGSYLAGVYYPDKTRVGWWKNGYPEYFAKILNGVNWIGVEIQIDGQVVDLNQVIIQSFERGLDLRHGVLRKKLVFALEENEFEIESALVCHMRKKELGLLDYSIRHKSGPACQVGMKSYLNFDVRNQDANYDEKFWVSKDFGSEESYSFLHSQTLKTKFDVCACMTNRFFGTPNMKTDRMAGSEHA